ncbi:MAG: hypothetical protein AAB090_04010, partial [Nitrospirota bacterium]
MTSDNLSLNERFLGGHPICPDWDGCNFINNYDLIRTTNKERGSIYDTERGSRICEKEQGCHSGSEVYRSSGSL